MKSTTTLTITDDIKLIVPDSLDLITPYVLQEQLDWFEDEIKFLRRLLKPGEKIIDIGANYGVYTLSMAKNVQPDGHIWAFEPASSTAKLLAESIAANSFDHVTLDRSALSNRIGSVQFSMSEHAELNAVVHAGESVANSETVPLTTLDQCMAAYDWKDITFVKIDAEGEEENIIEGGRRFFAEHSPLIQYEIKAGAGLNLGLAKIFAALGYQSYRLVPGLDVLVPFDPQSADGFLLNLFCCKPDRAARLAADNWLVLDAPAPSEDVVLNDAEMQRYGWRQTLATLPYGQNIADRWETTMSGPEASKPLEEALALHARSRDSGLPATARFAALQASFHKLWGLCIQEPLHLRMISFARVATEFGARQIAVEALGQQLRVLFKKMDVDLDEPFLPAYSRFDDLPPAEHYGNWVVGGTLEALERIEQYSSFYKPSALAERLSLILELGFGSEEMERRLALTQRRFKTGG